MTIKTHQLHRWKIRAAQNQVEKTTRTDNWIIRHIWCVRNLTNRVINDSAHVQSVGSLKALFLATQQSCATTHYISTTVCSQVHIYKGE